jgi:hypothetical protein
MGLFSNLLGLFSYKGEMDYKWKDDYGYEYTTTIDLGFTFLSLIFEMIVSALWVR